MLVSHLAAARLQRCDPCGFDGPLLERLEPRRLLAAPDLQMTTAFTGGTFLPGQSVVFSAFTLRNTGNAASSRFGAGIYLSLNNTAGDGDDILIYSTAVDRSGSGLNAAESLLSPDLRVPIPSSVAPGSYFLVARIDTGGEVSESNENNNSFVSGSASIVVGAHGGEPTSPDLTARIIAGAQTVVPGGTLAFSGTVSNIGNAPAGSFALRYVLSADGILGNGDDYTVGEFSYGSAQLDPGTAANAGQALLPSTIPNGVYRLGVVVDAGGAVDEGTTAELNNYAITSAATVTVSRPVVTVAASTPTTIEGSTTPGQFTITRSATGLNVGLTVVFSLSGTALINADYLASDTFLVGFMPGQATATVRIHPEDDLLAETRETVVLTLSNPSNEFTIGAAGSATVNIDDNEPTVSVAATTPSTTEGSVTPGRFTITRASGTTAPALTVYYTLTGSAANTADFTTLAGSAVIPAGQTSVVVSIAPVDDTLAEPAETVVMTLTPDPFYRLSPTPSMLTATVTINDNEPVISVTATDAAAGESAGTPNPGSYTLTRTGGSTAGSLTVNYTLGGTATADIDIPHLSGTVTFAPGSSTAVIPVTPIDDATAEPSETLILLLGWGAGYRINSTRQSATLTITDNEPTVTIVPAGNATEGVATPGRFTVTRTGPTTGPLTVNLAVSGTAVNGVDCAAVPSVVVIPAGAASCQVTVTPTNDSVGEPVETVVATLQPATGYLVGAAQPSATVTITDNEPTVTVTATRPTAAEGSATTGLFTFTRTGPTTGALDVFYDVSGTAIEGLDFDGPGSLVTIPAGQTSVTVPVTAYTDFFAEDSETVVVTVLNGNPGYRAGASPTATVTIPGAGPVVSITASTPTTTEGSATPGRFTISRTGATAAALTVYVTVSGSASAGSDYFSRPSSYVIPAGAASVTIDVRSIDDQYGEANETVVMTLAPANGYRMSGTQRIATITINDNEPAVTVTATDATLTEGPTDTARFTFTRTGSTASPLTVPYTLGGSAVAGADFTAPSGSITIPAGATSAVLNLAAIADGVVEGPESLIVGIASGDGFSAETHNSAAATISGTASADLSLTTLDALNGVFSVTQPGQVFGFSVHVHNNGFVSSLPGQLEARLSIDAIFGNADDIRLGTFAIPALAPGADQVLSLTLHLDAAEFPPSVAGPWFLALRSDAGHTTAEFNENNNDVIGPDLGVTFSF